MVDFPAVLTGGPFDPGDENALLTGIQAVTDGAFALTINGTAADTGPIDFSDTGADVQDLDGVAAAIENTLTDVTVVYAAGSFTITTDAVGPAATLTFARAPATGQDISGIPPTATTMSTNTRPTARCPERRSRCGRTGCRSRREHSV